MTLELVIDGRAARVEEGATVLDACRAAGADVPTLCWQEGHAPFTSCMVCVVKDTERDRLVPSCTAPAEDGMTIETDTAEVRAARKDALELLLSEHVGDCEGPCRRACPAGVDIPHMLRCLAAGDLAAAGRLAAAGAGGPCTNAADAPPPCERVCRRNQVDEAVAIRLLCRFAARHAPADRPGTNGTPARRFNSVIGKLRDEEKPRQMEGVNPGPRTAAAGGAEQGFSAEEAAREAARCMHCDCRKPDACRLRDYAAAYGADQRIYKGRERAAFEQDRSHPDLVYEPGKCIKCGICVTLAAAYGEPLGLAFLGRGYGMRIGVPFHRPLSEGLTRSAARCVESCPTGALAWREEGEEG